MGLRLSILRSGGDEPSEMDKLSPDVLACILKKASQGNPQRLKELARVNKSFRKATCLCATTLVVRQEGSSHASNNRALSPFSPRAALSREIKLRPRVSKLVIDWAGRKAIPGSLWPALYKVKWTSLEVRLSRKKSTCNFVRLLRASKLSLRTLELGGGYAWSYVARDIERIVHAFPKLESLTLREFDYWTSVSGGALEASEAANSLTSLHLAFPELGLAGAARRLPKSSSLRALRNLRIECRYVSSWVSKISADSPLRQIRGLRLDILDYQNLCNARLLQEVAQVCPCLQHLVLHNRPYSTRETTRPPLSKLVLSDLLESCSNLRDIMISRVEVVHRPQFSSKLVREFGHTPSEVDLKTVLLEVDVDPLIDSLETRVRIFRCIVPFGAPEVKWDCPENSKRLLGEAWAVREWSKVFCTTKFCWDRTFGETSSV